MRQFTGLSSYYRRFIPDFSKIAQPLHQLTRKGTEFKWSEECQEAFTILKEKLISPPVLAYPSFDHPFCLETDASIKGIGAVLSQPQPDGFVHPIAYASRSLSAAERNYSITELETLAVVWAIQHFNYYLYGQEVTVFTDHSAVKAILETPNPSGKHARWWTKVYGSGIGKVTIRYRSGKSNLSADALSRNPPPTAEDAVVAAVTSSEQTIQDALEADAVECPGISFEEEQRKDPDVMETIHFLENEELPADQKRATKIAAEQSLFALVDGVLYYVDPKRQYGRRIVVPRHLVPQILDQTHRSGWGGHFSGDCLLKALVRHWWWPHMYSDTVGYAKGCPECTIATGGGRVHRPQLHPIPVNLPFQIVGVDIMDLPKTVDGNKHVVVFQGYLTKWPMVYPVPDQKAERLARLLVNEVVPFFGVPESLLSDRGTNLLSHLMKDVCGLLGVKKLNTTAYHPQCDGMVERFNRTLKTILRKHAATFGAQWDRYLPGVLWAYRNTPHESTGEKPSYLMFGKDLRTPTEAAFLSVNPMEPDTVEDYREELTTSLTSARKLAATSIQRPQQRYKKHYDRKAVRKD